jgi:hypothetical protein
LCFCQGWSPITILLSLPLMYLDFQAWPPFQADFSCSILTSVQWYLIVVSICVSLMTNYAECLFTYLFSSSFVMYLFSLLLIFKLFLLKIMSFFYILDASPLSVVWFTDILSFNTFNSVFSCITPLICLLSPHSNVFLILWHHYPIGSYHYPITSLLFLFFFQTESCYIAQNGLKLTV